MFKKHSSIFIPVLILLTIVLVLVVVFATKPESQLPQKSETLVQVDKDQYRSDLSDLVKNFTRNYDSAPSEVAKLVVVENSLDKLLEMRVPSDLKDLHLEIALTMNQIKNSLKDGSSPAAHLNKFDEITNKNSWLIE